jgi:uncharacterized protein (DUF983 family)
LIYINSHVVVFNILLCSSIHLDSFYVRIFVTYWRIMSMSFTALKSIKQEK